VLTVLVFGANSIGQIPSVQFSYGSGFLCSKVQHRIQHHVGDARVPLRMYTLDASQFLHSIWDSGFALLDEDPQSEQQKYPSLVYGASCYEGDKFLLTPRSSGDELLVDSSGMSEQVQTLLQASVMMPSLDVGGLLVVGGLSGYAYGLNNAFNGINQAHVMLLGADVSVQELET
jgi:diaminopimelate decarboxylase